MAQDQSLRESARVAGRLSRRRRPGCCPNRSAMSRPTSLFTGSTGNVGGLGAGGWPLHGRRFSASRLNLPPAGPLVVHQYAGVLSDPAIESVHEPQGGLTGCSLELFYGGHPPLVRLHLQGSRFHQRLKIRAQFALSRNHGGELSKFRDQRLQCITVESIGRYVTNGNSSLRLLQSKVPHIAHDECQFLLVVRSPGGLPSSFHQHDAKGCGVFPGKGADHVGELIIRDKKPLSISASGLSFGQFLGKEAHGAYCSKSGIISSREMRSFPWVPLFPRGVAPTTIIVDLAITALPV